MDIKIYVATTIRCAFPKDSRYVPIYLGESALAAPPGSLTDRAGDNISTKNLLYNELTGLYWIWKNAPYSDYVGLCQYRRYFLFNPDAVQTKNLARAVDTSPLEGMLREADVILPLRSPLGTDTIESHYVKNHRAEDLSVIKEIIREKFPVYVPAMESVLASHEVYFSNMFVMPWNVFQQYMEWMFTILFEAERRIYLPYDDKYQRRALGFLSERLMNIYVAHHRFRVREVQKILLAGPATDVSYENTIGRNQNPF